MSVKHQLRFDMLLRVNAFGIAHDRSFPRHSAGRQLFDALRELVTRLPIQFTAQETARTQARDGTKKKTAARASLYAALAAINRTSRALAIDRPGFRGKFRLPSKESDDALLAAARAFVRDAQRCAHFLASYGLRAGFVDDLRAAVARFERAIADRAAGRRAHITARAGIEAALADSFLIVRRLDAVVVNLVGEDVLALEDWRRARRMGRGRASKDGRRRRTKARLTVIQPHNAEMAGWPE